MTFVEKTSLKVSSLIVITTVENNRCNHTQSNVENNYNITYYLHHLPKFKQAEKHKNFELKVLKDKNVGPGKCISLDKCLIIMKEL